ncbi:MAG: xanthine dehydrogenase accessory factor [Halieaceae bacterium]|jgi:xanthine dehydrogenase accessory factor
MNSTGHWTDWVRDCETRAEAYVIVTILGAQGSTPRGSGTKMVVSPSGFAGTIGGGQLEFAALESARELLRTGTPGQRVENFPLGEKLGQCCGGSTSLLLESFVPAHERVYLFGAGHVGRALAPVLAALPLQLHWVDTRREEFPRTLPVGVTQHCLADPLDIVKAAPENSYYLIMTHQHPLDYALLEAALRRKDAAYLGVIGSPSKWRRFRLRLEHRGYDAEAIDTVHCPIGLDAVPGKRPAEIAVSVAAQLIGHYHARHGDRDRIAGPGWKTLQAKLADNSVLRAPRTSTQPGAAHSAEAPREAPDTGVLQLQDPVEQGVMEEHKTDDL